SLALHREVELARVEAAAAVHREHRSVRPVDRDERRLWAVLSREPPVYRGAGQELQPEVDRRVHPDPAAVHALRTELRVAEQLLLHVLAEVPRLADDARGDDRLQ